MHNQKAAFAEPAVDNGPLASDLRARASFYQLLAGAFVEEPGAYYLNALRDPGALAALEGVGVRFDKDVTGVPLMELQDALAYEYTSLFASPGGCPAVESARLAGRFQQGPYHAVSAFYRTAGFTLQQGRFNVFEDQLGIELSFVAVLLGRQATALELGDTAAEKLAEKNIKRFWANHLGRWVRGYASLLERVAEHSFYWEIARLLSAFAEEELTLLKMHVDDVDGGRETVPKSDVTVRFNPDEPICNGCDHGADKAVA